MPLRIEVAIQRTLTALVADLRMSGRAGGTRQIEAVRCEGLTEALAVTLAMILDEEAVESRVSTAPMPSDPPPTLPARAEVPTGTDEVPPTRVVVKTSPKAERPAQKTPRQVSNPVLRQEGERELRAWIGGGYGSSRRWMLEVGGAYAYRAWGIELSAYVQPTHEMALGAGHLEVLSVGGVVAGCRQFGAVWRFVPCARATLGMTSVKGIGFDESSPQRLAVGSLGPGVGVETGMRWVTGLDLSAQFSMWRDEYVVENSRETAKTPPLTVWLVARVALSSR